MNRVLSLFKGLTKEYYFRQLFFGFLIFGVFLYLIINSQTEKQTTFIIIYMFINTLLYPYARFAYERVVGFILGNNIFFVNAIFMLIAKAITMVICWAFALYIAPIGLLLIYLYQKNK